MMGHRHRPHPWRLVDSLVGRQTSAPSVNPDGRGWGARGALCTAEGVRAEDRD